MASPLKHSSIDPFTVQQAPATTATWDVAPGAVPRGTVVLLAGRGEHPGVYARLGKRLAFDGYRLHIVSGSFTDPAAANRRVGEFLADSVPGKPRVLAGSDTGAASALALAVGAGTGNGPGKSPVVDAVVVAALPLDGAAGTGPDDTLRSACPVHRAVLADGNHLVPGALAVSVDPGVLPRPEDLALPVLAFHGGSDPVVSAAAARAYVARVPGAELVFTVGGLRDAFNDSSHRSVAARMVLFLERLGAGRQVLADGHRPPGPVGF